MGASTREDEAAAMLSGLRVLELSGRGGAYAGKLLADLGADVLCIEPPEGAVSRTEAPHSSAGASLPWAVEHAGKRTRRLDLASPSGRADFLACVAQADLLIDSLPVGRLETLGLGYAQLAAERPALVMTSLSGFGQTGPLAQARSNDLVASALGGAMISIGDPADPPVRLAGHQADVITGCMAASASLIALHEAARSGRGQQVDISALETMASITHIAGVGKWLEDGVVPRRVGTGLVASVPSGAYACRDGSVYLMVNRPAHWQALAEWIHEATGNEEVLQEVFRGPSSARLPYREFLDLFISELTGTLTVEEAYHEGQRRRIAFTPIHTATRLAEDGHLAARDFFQTLTLETGERVQVPRSPFRIDGARVGPVHDDASVSPAPASPVQRAPVPPRAGAPGKGALAGLRVVEFGTGLAAPWIGRILAWAGADVIKVESHGHPDVPRLYVSPREPERGPQPECSPWFTDWSAGKRFVALDLQTEGGAELGRRLVDESDVVLANYSTGALDRLGLGFETLSARNPGLVMLESSGYGRTGPLAHYVTWGPNIEALSGLASFSGFPGRDCTLSHFAYPDPLSALHGLVALMAALAERDRSGRGHHVELSQFETCVAALGREIVFASATGAEPPRRGNREPGQSPYGCFPCAGEDRWVVLCVEEDADWPRFVELLGRPEWALDPRYAAADARLAEEAEIESRIAAWTASRDAGEIVESARALGLAAGVVQTAEDLLRTDPQLADRGFFETIPHHKRGEVVASGIPLGLLRTPGRTTQSGSSIGHDNGAVLGEVLGLSEAEIERFVAQGAVEPTRTTDRA